MTSLAAPADYNPLSGPGPYDGGQASDIQTLHEPTPAPKCAHGDAACYIPYSAPGVPYTLAGLPYNEYRPPYPQCRDVPRHPHLQHPEPQPHQPYRQQQSEQGREPHPQEPPKYQDHQQRQQPSLFPPAWTPQSRSNWSCSSGSGRHQPPPPPHNYHNHHSHNSNHHHHQCRNAASPRPAPSASGSILPATPMSEPIASPWHLEGCSLPEASPGVIRQLSGLLHAPAPLLSRTRAPSPHACDTRALDSSAPAPPHTLTVPAEATRHQQGAFQSLPPPPPPALGMRHSGSASDEPTAAAGSSAGVALSAGGVGGAAHGVAPERTGPCSEAVAGVGTDAAATSGVRQAGRPPLPACPGRVTPLPPVTTGLPCQKLASLSQPQHQQQKQQQDRQQDQRLEEQQQQEQQKQQPHGQEQVGKTVGGTVVAAALEATPRPRTTSGEHEHRAFATQAPVCFDYASMWRVVGDTLEWPSFAPPPATAASCVPAAPGGAPCASAVSGACQLQGRLSSSQPHPPGNVITTGNSIERALPPLPQQLSSGKLATPAPVPTPAANPIAQSLQSPQPQNQTQHQQMITRRVSDATGALLADGGGGARWGPGGEGGNPTALLSDHLKVLQPRSAVAPNAVTTGVSPLAALPCTLVGLTNRPALPAAGAATGAWGATDACVLYRAPARRGRDGEAEAGGREGVADLADDAISTCGCRQSLGCQSAANPAALLSQPQRQQQQKRQPDASAPRVANAREGHRQGKRDAAHSENAKGVEVTEEEEGSESDASESSESQESQESQDVSRRGEVAGEQGARARDAPGLEARQKGGPDLQVRQRQSAAVPTACGLVITQRGGHPDAGAAQPGPLALAETPSPCQNAGLRLTDLPPNTRYQREELDVGGRLWSHEFSHPGEITAQPQPQWRTSRPPPSPPQPHLTSPFCSVPGCTACARYGCGPTAAAVPAAHDVTEPEHSWIAIKRRRTEAPLPPATTQQPTQELQRSLYLAHLAPRSLIPVSEPASGADADAGMVPTSAGVGAGASSAGTSCGTAGATGVSGPWVASKPKLTPAPAVWDSNGDVTPGSSGCHAAGGIFAYTQSHPSLEVRPSWQLLQHQQPQHSARPDAWPTHASKPVNVARWLQTTSNGDGGGDGSRKRLCNDGEVSGTNSSYSAGGSGAATAAAAQRQQLQQQQHVRGNNSGAAGRSNYSELSAPSEQPPGPGLQSGFQPASGCPTDRPRSPPPQHPSAPDSSAAGAALPMPQYYGPCKCSACVHTRNYTSAPPPPTLYGTLSDSAMGDATAASFAGRAFPGCTCEQCRASANATVPVMYPASALPQPQHTAPTPPPPPHCSTGPYHAPSGGSYGGNTCGAAPRAVPLSYMEYNLQARSTLSTPLQSQPPPPRGPFTTSGQDQGHAPPWAREPSTTYGNALYDKGGTVAPMSASGACMCPACRSAAGASSASALSFGGSQPTGAYAASTPVAGRSCPPPLSSAPGSAYECASPRCRHGLPVAPQAPRAAPPPPPLPYSTSTASACDCGQGATLRSTTTQPTSAPLVVSYLPPSRPPAEPSSSLNPHPQQPYYGSSGPSGSTSTPASQCCPYIAPTISHHATDQAVPQMLQQQLLQHGAATLPSLPSYTAQNHHHHLHNLPHQRSGGSSVGLSPHTCSHAGCAAAVGKQHAYTIASPRFHQHQQHYHQHAKQHQHQHQRSNEMFVGQFQIPPFYPALPAVQPPPYTGTVSQASKVAPPSAVLPPRPGHWPQAPGNQADTVALGGGTHCTPCYGVGSLVPGSGPPSLPPSSYPRVHHPYPSPPPCYQPQLSQQSTYPPGSDIDASDPEGHSSCVGAPALLAVATTSHHHQQHALSESAAVYVGASAGVHCTATAQGWVARTTHEMPPAQSVVMTTGLAQQDMCDTALRRPHFDMATPACGTNPTHPPPVPGPGPAGTAESVAGFPGPGSGEEASPGMGAPSLADGLLATANAARPLMGSQLTLLSAAEEEEAAMWEEDPLMPWCRRRGMRPT